jgi:ketosteroid isomerase-like protein
VDRGTPEQARTAVRRHVERWNARDKQSWLELFDEDVTYEDPPGTVAARGRTVMSEYAWDRSFTEDKRWILEASLILAGGHEAAVYMRNHGSVAGVPAWTDSIELWAVNAAGLVTSVRAFWEPPAGTPLYASLGVSEWQGETTLSG